MKQLWIASAILALMIGLLAWNTWYLRSVTEPLAEDLLAANRAAAEENWERAETLSRKSRDAWEAQIARLRLSQSHDDLTEIAALMDEALAFLHHNDLGEYAAANTRAAESLRELNLMERFSLGNLF